MSSHYLQFQKVAIDRVERVKAKLGLKERKHHSSQASAASSHHDRSQLLSTLKTGKSAPTDTIERLHAKDLPLDTFLRKNEKLCRPVVIQGLLEEWKALERWSLYNLVSKYSDEEFIVGRDQNQNVVTVKMKYFAYYLKEYRDPSPFQIADDLASGGKRKLRDDYEGAVVLQGRHLQVRQGVRPAADAHLQPGTCPGRGKDPDEPAALQPVERPGARHSALVPVPASRAAGPALQRPQGGAQGPPARDCCRVVRAHLPEDAVLSLAALLQAVGNSAGRRGGCFRACRMVVRGDQPGGVCGDVSPPLQREQAGAGVAQADARQQEAGAGVVRGSASSASRTSRADATEAEAALAGQLLGRKDCRQQRHLVLQRCRQGRLRRNGVRQLLRSGDRELCETKNSR
ncbi:hypothetical protein MTO96_027467 [Rhipicephalus appendiculatus]